MRLTKNNTIVHIEELLNVFHDIDNSIRELHQNSSQVFLQLNDFLKDYHKKNSIVSTNATQIFDTIAGNKESCLTCELNLIFDEFENYKNEADYEFDTNLSIYALLDKKLSYLSMGLRNFKQDLLTLKFLITNYKIIPENGATTTVPSETISEWEKAILHINHWVSGIGTDIAKFIERLGNLSMKTRSFSQNSVNKNFSLNEELKSAIALVNKKNLESKNYIPVLKEKINSSSVSIGNIITHLQYHDIIRQKIEHIQLSHLKIIASLEKEVNNPESRMITEESNIIALIADISGLQAEQLILISKEYQNALEVISDNFQRIGDDLTTVSNISHEFSFETNNSDTTLIRLVKERLDRSLLLLDEHNSSSFNHELITVKTQVAELYSSANERIFTPVNLMENYTFSPDKHNRNKNSASENKPSILDQIGSITKDVLEKKDDLQKEFTEVLKLTEKISIEDDSNGFRSNLEKEQIRIMVRISKTLDRLDVESKQLDSVLLENCCIKKDIINKLKETMNQADYYELFEKVLNVIIDQLNSMNNKLRLEGIDSDKSERVKNFKDIEAFYTVASERIIHQKVLNEEKEIVLPAVQPSEENLELF
jgi:hypothetical protein